MPIEMTSLDYFATHENTMPIDRDRNRIAKDMGFDNEREATGAGALGAIYARYRYERAQDMIEERDRLRAKDGPDETNGVLRARLRVAASRIEILEKALKEAQSDAS